MWTPHHIFEDTVMPDKLNTLSHAVLELSTFSTCKYIYNTVKCVSQNPAILFVRNVVITHDVLRHEMSSRMSL